jgi:hypothetical protein
MASFDQVLFRAGTGESSEKARGEQAPLGSNGKVQGACRIFGRGVCRLCRSA